MYLSNTFLNVCTNWEWTGYELSFFENCNSSNPLTELVQLLIIGISVWKWKFDFLIKINSDNH